jgi:hypothetical protein
MADDQFFAAPPSEEPTFPGGEDGGFTFLGDDAGDAAPPAAFVGDVQEGGDDDDIMGFAGAPVGDEDAFGAPPAEEPIVLGPPPEEPVLESPEETADASDAFGAVVTTSGEPGPMQKWNAEWQETLAARKDEENAKKVELIEATKIFQEEFKRDREAKREAKMSKNREDEQAKLEAIEADLENDNSWQRVSKLVDTTQDGAEAGTDTKKMRDIFILLKNDQGLSAKVGA